MKKFQSNDDVMKVYADWADLDVKIIQVVNRVRAMDNKGPIEGTNFKHSWEVEHDDQQNLSFFIRASWLTECGHCPEGKRYANLRFPMSYLYTEDWYKPNLERILD